MKRIKNTDSGFEESYETSNTLHKIINTIFADEDVIVSRDKTVEVKIVPLDIPKSCLCFLDSYMRHPNGNVIMLKEDPQMKIEHSRTARGAIFFAVDDGVIEKGDVIGVVDFIVAEVFKLSTEEFDRLRARLRSIKEIV
ncbi:MAG: DUF22 domain-containing protein [Candidatus Hydrothermarchaeaceae archaeon]